MMAFTIAKGNIDWARLEGADAFITELWMAGKSSTQIAHLVADKFDLVMTRNKIIGRLTRLGVTNSATGNKLTGETQKNPNAPKVTTRINVANVQEQHRVKRMRARADKNRAEAKAKEHQRHIEQAPATLRAIEDAPTVAPNHVQGIAYRDLADDQCQWPLSGNGLDMICCGGKTLPRKPYCAHHIRANVR